MNFCIKYFLFFFSFKRNSYFNIIIIIIKLNIMYYTYTYTNTTNLLIKFFSPFNTNNKVNKYLFNFYFNQSYTT